MKTQAFAFAAVFAACNAYATAHPPTKVLRDERGSRVARQAKGVQHPSEFPVPNAYKSQGCFSSQGNMTLHKAVEMMSTGSCNDACKQSNFWVAGMKGAQCFCGYAYPPQDDLVSDQKCNFPCPYYDLEACGGINPSAWSIFNTGLNIDVANYGPSSSTSASSSKASTSSTAGSDATQPAVVTETQTPTQTPDSDKKSGPSTAGIAAGCVSGVVGAAAIIGGIFFFLRRRRNSEIEEEHRRNAAVNAFINGSKPPGSSGSISMTDARLDPVLAHRRMSDGSIADNEDYSRRILRVTNA